MTCDLSSKSYQNNRKAVRLCAMKTRLHFDRIPPVGVCVWGGGGGGGGGSGGAKVLRKLPVLGRPSNLDYRRARAFCTCSRCGWGLFGHFFLSSITSLFFLPLSGRRPDINRNTVSKGR